MNAKEIKVLMVEPWKYPKVVMLKDDLDSLQKAVSIGADYLCHFLCRILVIRDGVLA